MSKKIELTPKFIDAKLAELEKEVNAKATARDEAYNAATKEIEDLKEQIAKLRPIKRKLSKRAEEDAKFLKLLNGEDVPEEKPKRRSRKAKEAEEAAKHEEQPAVEASDEAEKTDAENTGDESGESAAEFSVEDSSEPENDASADSDEFTVSDSNTDTDVADAEDAESNTVAEDTADTSDEPAADNSADNTESDDSRTDQRNNRGFHFWG